MRVVLELGDERIPLYFGMVAFEEIQKLANSYMGANKFACDVVWSGYLNQCALDSQFASMTYQELMEKMEEVYFSQENPKSNLNEVLTAFDKSKAGSKLFDNIDKALEVVDVLSNELEELSAKKKTQKTSQRKSPTKKLRK